MAGGGLSSTDGRPVLPSLLSTIEQLQDNIVIPFHKATSRDWEVSANANLVGERAVDGAGGLTNSCLSFLEKQDLGFTLAQTSCQSIWRESLLAVKTQI